MPTEAATHSIKEQLHVYHPLNLFPLPSLLRTLSKLTTLLITLLTAITTFSGCTSWSDLDSSSSNNTYDTQTSNSNWLADPGGVMEQVYIGSFSDVLAATQTVFSRYTLRIENTEAGIMETEWIRDDRRFAPAHIKSRSQNGVQYRLRAQIVRGQSGQSPAIKVLINKIMEKRRDFFSEPEPLKSDGLEERIILYRIERELMITKARRKKQI